MIILSIFFGDYCDFGEFFSALCQKGLRHLREKYVGGGEHIFSAAK